MCLGSFSCCISQVCLRWPDTLLQDFLIECRIHSWFHQLWQSSRSWRPSHYHLHVWLLVWCFLWNTVLFLCQMQRNTHLPTSSTFVSSVHRILTLIEACRSLDVVLCFFMTSWMSRHCALGVILVGRPLLGRFITCSKFSPFVDNGSDRGSLKSQSLGNIFKTLSRLIHVNYVVSHLFLNFFRSRHDVLLFKHASLCQRGSI